MSRLLHPLPRSLLVIALYVLGAYLAASLMLGPDRVTLVWLPAGLALALLLVFGRRQWPLIVLADALFQIGHDAPWLFVPFSATANTVAALVAATVAIQLGGRGTWNVVVRTGLVLLVAAVVLSAVSAPIGVLGLVLADMTPASQYGAALAKWFIGDLFGVVLVAPAMLLAVQALRWPATPLHPPRYARLRERVTWVLLLVGCVPLFLASGGAATTYALGMTGVPLAFLIWSALRFPPLFTALASLAVGMALISLTGWGVGGFHPPPTLYDSLILLLFLSTVAVVPLFLAAANNESRMATERLLEQARRDELTGLPSRSGFEAQARPLIDGGGEEPMALAYIDLDQFKLINDSASHAAGDELVKRMAGALKSAIEPGDLIGRMGGDEFAVLLRRRLPLEAERAAEQLRDTAAGLRFAHGAHVFSCTASIGLVPFQPRRSDYPTLLAEADAACFTAKELGGNRVQAVSGSELARREKTTAMRWALRLTRAIERDQFRLYCQSVVPLTDGRGDGQHFEILLRLYDPDLGTIPPDRFVPAAERFRLGARLDRHVVERTLDWIEQHPTELARIGLCAINLCAESVNDPGFVPFLRKRLMASTVPAGKLCFEITETSAVRDMGEARRFIDGVRGLGCRLALDDFGTGFCSFAYLEALDVDYFKIDGSFVRGLETSPLSHSIVRAIADIARGIDKRTIAEFVETPAIAQKLRELGVDYAQGYAYDAPVPIEQYFHTAPASEVGEGEAAA